MNRIGVPPVIVCPRCEGQRYDRESCGLCANAGYLTERGAEKLTFAQRVQMLSTLAISTGISLSAPSKSAVLGRCEHGTDLDRDFCPSGCRV